MNSRIQFSILIQKNYSDFQYKMEQSKLFQLQEKLSENIVNSYIFDTKNQINNAEIAVYQDNINKLKNMGKTYKNVFQEKLFTDTYRIFEEYLKDIFSSIFVVFPFFLTKKNKEEDSITEEISVPFKLIFTNESNIQVYKDLFIANRVKIYLQGDNIMKILGRFETTFNLQLTITDDEKIECQKTALLRNIIAHNNSTINEIYLASIDKFKIKNNVYKLGNSVLSNLEVEINDARSILVNLANKINANLVADNNFKALENFNNSKLNIL